MTTYRFNETDVELAALQWLGEVGYAYAGGPDLAPDSPTSERESYRYVILADRLRAALAQLNPDLPQSARANMRILVKHILLRYGYPPDKQEAATRTVIQQAELLSQGWVGVA